MAALIGVAVVALIVVTVGARQSVNLFEPGRAKHAYELILAAELQHKVTKLEVTPKTLLVQFPNGENSSRIEWTAGRANLFGWTEWDRVSGPRTNYNVSIEDDSHDPFDAQPDDTADLTQLATVAATRAGGGQNAVVSSMVLRKDHDFAHPEPPRWTVHISDANGSHKAKVIADRRGELYPATREPAGPPRIVIKVVPGNAFTLFPGSDTWIRVINPDRSVRFDDSLKIGASYSVPDVPGLILQTGKPETLDVTVDRHPVQLPRAGYAGRLEMVLDPQALLDGRAARN